MSLGFIKHCLHGENYKDGIYRGMMHIELITSMYVVLLSGVESDVQLGSVS